MSTTCVCGVVLLCTCMLSVDVCVCMSMNACKGTCVFLSEWVDEQSSAFRPWSCFAWPSPALSHFPLKVRCVCLVVDLERERVCACVRKRESQNARLLMIPPERACCVCAAPRPGQGNTGKLAISLNNLR